MFQTPENRFLFSEPVRPLAKVNYYVMQTCLFEPYYTYVVVFLSLVRVKF